MKKVFLSIYLEEDFAREIERTSKKAGISKSAFAVQLMESGMKKFKGEGEEITREEVKNIFQLLEDIAKNSYGAVLASFKLHEPDEQKYLSDMAEKRMEKFLGNVMKNEE